jgi:hypothetical protein
MPCAHLPPFGRLCGAKLTKRSTSQVFEFGLGATVVADQSETGNQKSLTGFVRGEKHGWRIASQTLKQGKSAASTRQCAFIGLRADVDEGAAKSAYLQSISARWTQAAAV